MLDALHKKCQHLEDYLKTQFTDHPAQLNQSWGQHCRDNLWFSLLALAAGGALLIHAFIPCWLQEWGGDQLVALNSRIQEKRMAPRLRTRRHRLVQSVHE